MSWTWRYTLSQISSALHVYHMSSAEILPEKVFFYMCFFVNNQFRLGVFLGSQQSHANRIRYAGSKRGTRVDEEPLLRF